MPYKIKGKCIYRSDTGKKVGCTKGEVKKYLAALHANVKETCCKENSMKLRSILESTKKEKINHAANEISKYGNSIEVFPDVLPHGSYSIIRVTSHNIEFEDRRKFEQFLSKLKSDGIIHSWEGPIEGGLGKNPYATVGYVIYISNFGLK